MVLQRGQAVKLTIPMCLTADEVHFLIVCLYPQLQSIPYELCKATGPGHCVLVPLAVEDETKKPRRGSPFTPYFSCVKLKELIGRKGKLYIRPLEAIQDNKCPSLTEIEVIFFFMVSLQILMSVTLQAYTPQRNLSCLQCKSKIELKMIPFHMHLCVGEGSTANGGCPQSSPDDTSSGPTTNERGTQSDYLIGDNSVSQPVTVPTYFSSSASSSGSGQVVNVSAPCSLITGSAMISQGHIFNDTVQGAQLNGNTVQGTIVQGEI